MRWTPSGLVGLAAALGPVVQGEDEPEHVADAAEAPEAVLGTEQRGADPSLEHLPASPSLDVSGVARGRAVEIPGRPHGSLAKAQVRLRRTTVRVSSSPLAYGSRRARTFAFPGAGEIAKAPLAEWGRSAVEGGAQASCDPDVPVLGRMSQDAALLVHLAALHAGDLAGDLGEAPARAFPLGNRCPTRPARGARGRTSRRGTPPRGQARPAGARRGNGRRRAVPEDMT